MVAELLGRTPRGEFEVVVRSPSGRPAVVRNAPLLDDGTPMPTRFWLCDAALRSAIGTVESQGGVRRAEAAVTADDLAATHRAYAVERDTALPTGHVGPVPSGGVGGDPPRGEVPARPLRPLAGGWRRPGRILGPPGAPRSRTPTRPTGPIGPIGPAGPARPTGPSDPTDRPFRPERPGPTERTGPTERPGPTRPTRSAGPSWLSWPCQGMAERATTASRPMSSPVAAIDCGTNSVRLLVSQDGGTTLERLMRITRLGQGVDGSRRLDPAAIERTVAVLAEYRAVMDRLGVERVRMAATSAVRDASNRDDFLSAAAAVVGVTPELLSGEEEGRLSFEGATAELDPVDGPFLVFDIGGGSTELTYGTTAAEATVSLDIGCVRITEAWLHSDPPTAVELSQALSVIEIHLDDVVREIPEAAEAATFVGWPAR